METQQQQLMLYVMDFVCWKFTFWSLWSMTTPAITTGCPASWMGTIRWMSKPWPIRMAMGSTWYLGVKRSSAVETSLDLRNAVLVKWCCCFMDDDENEFAAPAARNNNPKGKDVRVHEARHIPRIRRVYQLRDRSWAFLTVTYRLYKTKTPIIIHPILNVLRFIGMFVIGGGLSRSILS